MFNDHLSKSKVTYLAHLKWALTAGFRLIYAGLASILHGLNPKMFDSVAPKTIIDIYHSHLVNHPNKEYTDLIQKAKKNND